MPEKFDWMKLIEMAAPVVGGLVAKGAPAQTGFQQGWMQGQQMARQEKERRRLEGQRTSSAGSEYLLEVGMHAQEIEDPAQFEDFLRLADVAGVRAGYILPGDLKRTIRFSPTKLDARKLKELTDQLGKLESGGYNLDELSESGATLQLSDGAQVPITAALEIARQRPTIGGVPVPKPKKQDTASTDYGRFLSKFAKDKGKSVDQLTTTDELDAKRVYASAGNALPDPDMAAMNKTLKELQVEAAQKRLTGDPEISGLNKSLKELQVAAAQDKLDVSREKREAGVKADSLKRDNALRMADDLTEVVDELLDPQTGTLTPGASAIVGLRMPFASMVPESQAADAKAALDRLVGQLVIDLMREMKEQSRTGATGFGQLNEAELALLLASTTKLTNRNMSEAAFATELKRIRDKVRLIYQEQPQAGAAPAAGGGRMYYDADGNPVTR